MIHLTKKRYAELLRAEYTLECLEEFGVDNWIGYGDHHSEDNEWEDWDYLSNEDVVIRNGFTIQDTDDLYG